MEQRSPISGTQPTMIAIPSAIVLKVTPELIFAYYKHHSL
jgi:hypothetical protein